jgi:hypothetical protein
VVVDDSVVINRAGLAQAIAEQNGLTLERADELIRKALPQGVADVTIGSVCTANPELQCAPLPNGKVIHFTHPAVRT